MNKPCVYVGSNENFQNKQICAQQNEKNWIKFLSRVKIIVT